MKANRWMRGMRVLDCLSSRKHVLLLMAFLCAGRAFARPAPQQSATPPEVERLASLTAKRIAKAHLHVVLTTPMQNCLDGTDLCAQLDAALHAASVKEIPDAQFVARDDAIKLLPNYGFLKIDAYLGALDDIGGDAGAEVVVSENIIGKDRDCRLRTTIVDTRNYKWLDDLGVGIACPSLANTEDTLLTDVAAGAAIVATIPRSHSFAEGRPLAKAQPPRCVPTKNCPVPHNPDRRAQGSVTLLATVTELGTISDLQVLNAGQESLVQPSIDAVSMWRLEPAVGPDGKIYVARIKIETNFLADEQFRLLPSDSVSRSQNPTRR